jgi:N-acetylneuraminic acid mutarotase
MNKTLTHLLLALGLPLLAACSADSLSSPNTGLAQRAAPLLEDSASGACWASTGTPTTTTRVGHSVTRLPNGKVLVAGGHGDGIEMHRTAEVYDPASGTWSPTGSMTVPRREHTATLLPNGKVLVVSGDANVYSPRPSSAELYDPATGTWSAAAAMATPRHRHTATLLPNGKVLIVGGANYDGVVGAPEVYDPATGTWSAAGSLGTPRYGHTATLLPDGKVLLVGGVSPRSAYVASAEVYDPTTGTWSAAGFLATPRYRHTATLLPDGKVLISGGTATGAVLSSAEVYEPATGTWSAAGSMASPRTSHTAALLPNGRVFVSGGTNRGVYLTSAEEYDPATGTWSAAGALASPRALHTAMVLPNGKVLLVGGYSASSVYALGAELYACGGEAVATCPDGSPWSEVTLSSGALSLRLHCPQQMTLECGASTWVDPGATAAEGASPLEVHKYNTGDDDGDGVPGAQDPDDHGPGPNMSNPGSYAMEYIAWSAAGTVSALRTVHVQDSTPPVLKLKGPARSTHVCGSAWTDPGVEARDLCDGDLTFTVQTAGYVNGWSEGTYTLTYALTDRAGHSAPPLTRTVDVIDCPW